MTDYVEGQDSPPLGEDDHGLVGEDHLWGDAQTISAFSGHGGHNGLAFRRGVPTPAGTICQVNLHNRMRLGLAWGTRARVTMIAASCVGYAADVLTPEGPADFWDGLGRSNSWQYLAFYDSPAFDSGEMMTFYNLVDQGHSNQYAWIYGLDFSAPDNNNQPIVYTLRNPIDDAAQPPAIATGLRGTTVSAELARPELIAARRAATLRTPGRNLSLPRAVAMEPLEADARRLQIAPGAGPARR